MNENNGDHFWQFTQDAVRQSLTEAGPRKISALDTALSTLQREKQRLTAQRPKVFLALPTHIATGTHRDAWMAFLTFSSIQNEISVIMSNACNSLLAHGFNLLWAEALARRKTDGVTHFAMLHGDVAPQRYWLDTLWEEITRLQADIVSAVIPIKSPGGLTSTGISSLADPWIVRRLTMTEIMDLPETFDINLLRRAETAGADDELVVNTGCWIADLRKPWVDAVDERGRLQCYFTIDDEVVRDAEGRYTASVAPEDWNFSRMVKTASSEAKIYATRKVLIHHKGEASYPNNVVWGEEKTDRMWAAMQPKQGPAGPEEAKTENIEQEELLAL